MLNVLNNTEALEELHSRLKMCAKAHGFKRFVPKSRIKSVLRYNQNDELLEKALDCDPDNMKCPALVALLYFIKSQVNGLDV